MKLRKRKLVGMIVFYIVIFVLGCIYLFARTNHKVNTEKQMGTSERITKCL